MTIQRRKIIARAAAACAAARAMMLRPDGSVKRARILGLRGPGRMAGL